jgi:hypothetical protein
VANIFVKAERVVSAALGLLEREIVLPRLVTRMAEADFVGAKDDTVNVRVGAYMTARSRGLRSGSARTRDELTERSIPVQLTTDVYKDIKLTDANLTLDVSNFEEQVLQPAAAAVARRIEEELIATISGATYARSIAFPYSTGNAWKDLIVKARELLNKHHVPNGGRVLAVGSGIETAMLNTDLFVQAQQSGSTSALEEATIGRKAGFQIVSVPGLGPDEAYAFHATAFAMAQRAPAVPAGAPWGASRSYGGFALRAVQVLDPSSIEDVLALDAFLGTAAVRDAGYFDAHGVFVPAEGPLGDPKSCTIAASTDQVTCNAHGFANGDLVVFTALTGGAPLQLNRAYYVVNAATNTFQVAATPGGSAIDITSDATAGTVRKNGNEILVRAVKITAS